MPQDFIIPTNSGNVPQSSLIASYFDTATYTPNGAIRGDTALAATIQPVFQNVPGSATLYSPDYLSSDVIMAQLGPIDSAPIGGTFLMGVQCATILSVATSGSYPIQTAAAHNLLTNDVVQIVGSATTPSIDGRYAVTVVNATHFTIASSPVVTGSAAGGNIYCINGTGFSLTSIAYNISAGSLAALLTAASIQFSLPAFNITLLATGSYQCVGVSNGAVANNLLYADVTYIQPQAQWTVLQQSLGSTGSPFNLTLIIEQAPFCFSQFSTPLPATGVGVSTIQAGSTTSNQILQVAFTQPNTYAGAYTVSAMLAQTVQIVGNTIANPTVVQTATPHLFVAGTTVTIPTNNGSSPAINGTQTITIIDSTHFSIPVNVTTAGVGGTVSQTLTATCGQAVPGMSNVQLSYLLANHPYVVYANAAIGNDNIVVTLLGNLGWTVQFTGTLGNSSVPALSFPANTLVGPQGFSGLLNYNTVQLYAYSRTQAQGSFTVPFSISRIRTSGEKRTIFGPIDWEIYKDNLDYLTTVPVSLPGGVIVNPSTGALISPTAQAFFNANFPTWLLSLNTYPVSGTTWNDGGIPTYTP